MEAQQEAGVVARVQPTFGIVSKGTVYGQLRFRVGSGFRLMQLIYKLCEVKQRMMEE